MNYAYIAENYFVSSSFRCVDNREFLYSTNDFCPTSSVAPIVWQDQERGSVARVGPMVDAGDLSISKELMEIIMSFDPYGIECYPSKLELVDGDLEERYLLAVNNIIDVMNEDESDVEKSPYNDALIVYELYLSEEKLQAIPLHKRVVYRVQGAETAMFFCEEIFDLIDGDERFDALIKIKDDVANETPEII